MQVNISFNTESESLQNLKKLVDALQQLIDHREGKQSSAHLSSTQTSIPSVKVPPARTSGGCRVIPYEDMSDKMSALLSGRRL
jgi:hypothetical protein